MPGRAARRAGSRLIAVCEGGIPASYPAALNPTAPGTVSRPQPRSRWRPRSATHVVPASAPLRGARQCLPLGLVMRPQLYLSRYLTTPARARPPEIAAVRSHDGTVGVGLRRGGWRVLRPLVVSAGRCPPLEGGGAGGARGSQGKPREKWLRDLAPDNATASAPGRPQ